MRIRGTLRLAQPFITSPERRTPSSDGRSPNGSSPSPTISKTAIVASTQNAAVSCTLRRERRRSHGGLPPLGPSRCCAVMPSSSKLSRAPYPTVPRRQRRVLPSVSYTKRVGIWVEVALKAFLERSRGLESRLSFREDLF